MVITRDRYTPKFVFFLCFYTFLQDYIRFSCVFFFGVRCLICGVLMWWSSIACASANELFLPGAFLEDSLVNPYYQNRKCTWIFLTVPLRFLIKYLSHKYGKFPRTFLVHSFKLPYQILIIIEQKMHLDLPGASLQASLSNPHHKHIENAPRSS